MQGVQTIGGGMEVFTPSYPAFELTVRKPGAMGRAFLLSLGLHLAGAALLLLAIRHWPVVTRPAGPIPLELELTAPQAPVAVVPALPLWEQAAPAVPVDIASGAMMAAAVPEARGVPIPEPAVAVTPGGSEPMAPLVVEASRESSLFPAYQPGPVEAGARPLALSGIQPRYPYGARTRGEAGRVTVHVKVTPEGALDRAEVRASSGYNSLDQSALAATRKAAFKPAERAGQRVPSEMDLQFEFRLQD